MNRATPPVAVAAALAAWAVVTASLVLAEAQHALADSALPLMLTVTAALGLGLVARWWALLALPLLIPVAALEGEAYDVAFLLIFLVPVVGLVVLLAAAAGTLLRPRRTTLPGAALLVASLLAVAVAALLELRVVDRTPDRPLAVDVERGAFGPVRLGARVSTLKLGRVKRLRLLPVEALSGPSFSFPAPLDFRRLARPGLSVFTSMGRVLGFVTSDPRSELGGEAGVGVGDSLELVEKRLDGFTCDGVATEGESLEPTYHACSRSSDRRTLWLGGDPIDSIWLYEDAE